MLTGRQIWMDTIICFGFALWKYRFITAQFVIMDNLLAFLHSIHPLSPGLREHLLQHLRAKELKRKQFLLRAGQVSKEIYFIEQGLLRCFYLLDGVEVCSWFMKEGDVIVSVPSFFNQMMSYECIQSLEDSQVCCISYEQLQFIYKNFLEFNFIGRILLEKYYTMSEARLYSLRMQRSIERYKYLMSVHPELIRRVPSKYLASYLGVREETLSRLRGKR